MGKRGMLIILFILLLSSTIVNGDIEDSDINFFLKKIATTKDQVKKELGIELLKAFVDTEERDVEGLKEIIKLTATIEDIEKLEKAGYSLDKALNSLDIFKKMSNDDVKKLIKALDEQNLEEIKEVIEKYIVLEEKPKLSYDKKFVEVRFTDIDGHWAKESIEFLSARKIIEGQGEEIFNPDAKITRVEFTTLIVRLFDLQEVQDDTTNNFIDINETDWFYSIVLIGNQHNIINGIDQNHFAPNEFITREQMITVIIRALSNININDVQTYENDIDKFEDKESISNWSLKHIKKALSFGIINGREENILEPMGSATRAEAAIIIKKVYDLLQLI